MDILDEIRQAKKELTEANELKCVCSGFCLQYEGSCQCERGRKIRATEAKIHNLINKI